MARVNKCRICGSTGPESGWAGTNHSLCNDCIPVVQAERRARQEARINPTSAGSLMAAALWAAVLPTAKEKMNG